MNKKDKIYIYLLYACLAAGFVVLCAALLMVKADSVKIDNEVTADFSDAWQIYKDDVFMGEMDLPCKIDGAKGCVLRAEKELPKDLKQNSTLFFRTLHSYVKVLAGDELLYSFGYSAKLPFGSSPGNAWQVVRIPPSTFGTKIIIEISSPYAQFSGRLDEVSIGTKASIAFSIIRDNAFSAIIGILILLSSVGMLIMFFMSKGTVLHFSFLHLSAFAFLLGVWAISESRMLQIWVGNSFFYTNLVFVTFFLLPIPFTLFLLSLDCFENDRVVRAFCALFVLNCIAVNALQLFNIADYYITMPFTHILAIAGCIYVLWQFKKNKNSDVFKETYTISLFINMMLIVSVISIVLFYLGHAVSGTTLMSAGFFAFVMLLVWWLGKRIISNYSLRIEKETYRQMAYKDVLTSLSNRVAFEEEITDYRLEKNDMAVFVELDLNNLKQINDKHSHRAGDIALVGAATHIRSVFAKSGKCYRVGGDEFCVICKDTTEEEVLNLLQRMQEEMKMANRSREIPISLAYGTAMYQNGALSVDDALSLADKQMYICKAGMKTGRDN